MQFQEQDSVWDSTVKARSSHLSGRTDMAVDVCGWGQRFAGRKDPWANRAHTENFLLKKNLPEHNVSSETFIGVFVV